jgi:hypothetical protein
LGIGLALVALVLVTVGALWYFLHKRRNDDTAPYSVEADVAVPPSLATESVNSDFDTLSQEAFTQVALDTTAFDETVLPTF